MSKTYNKSKFLVIILIIFSILMCLSTVSAENTNDLSIQDSSLEDLSIKDFSFDDSIINDSSIEDLSIKEQSLDENLVTQDLSIDEGESVDKTDDALISKHDSTNASQEDDCSKENMKSSSSNALQSSKLGKDISVIGNSFKVIQDAINGADSGDTIYLNALGGILSTYQGTGNQININKPITIIGNSSSKDPITLNANYLSRIFYITANDVTIINIKFMHGQVEDDGGAIYWGASNGILRNCSFSFNSAHSTYDIDYDGGAVFFKSKFNNNYVENCVFSNNSAYSGGSISMWSSNSIISNCTFDSNYGLENERGGDPEGAGIFLDADNTKILNCVFLNNVALEGFGAAIDIYANNPYIFNCSFKNNSAAFGGAIRWLSKGNGIILNCSFENNKATSDEYTPLGGAIYKNGDWCDIVNSTFKNNSATSGSAIYVENSATIDGCTFKENSAGSEGAIFITYNDVVIRNSLFDSNYAMRYGAAIYSWSGSDNIVVENSRFISNHVQKNGGAILFVGKNCKISNSIFEKNKAEGLLCFGGAICMDNSGDRTSIENCTFNKNSATVRGGAIYWMNDTLKKGVITNSTFKQNTATIGGGAISVLEMGLIEIPDTDSFACKIKVSRK